MSYLTDLDSSTSSNLSQNKNVFTVNNVFNAVIEDLGCYQKLVNKTTTSLFGEVDVSKTLDLSILSKSLKTPNNEVLALLCLNNYPNIPSIPSWDWIDWLKNKYDLETIYSSNTFWIHLLLWDTRYTYEFLPSMLQKIFAENYNIEHVILIVPPGISIVECVEGYGTRILPAGYSESSKVQTLYLLVRQHFTTKYKIRRAVEEDNDDLVPLIHTHSKRLQQCYGDFYIAEMLTRHPDMGRQIIVAEYMEHAVAVLCLNETVNDLILNGEFELLPFYGLRKPHEEDRLKGIVVRASYMPLVEGDNLSTIQFSSKNLSDDTKSENEDDLPKIGEISEDDFTIINLSSTDLLINGEVKKFTATPKVSTSNDYSAILLWTDDYKMHLYDDKSLLKILSFDDLKEHKIKDSRSLGEIPFLPSFYGEINAFTLELAAFDPMHETESLWLLLEAAFECFPDRDYCIFSIPSTWPSFPLLRFFVRVSPRNISTYPQDLYVLHRNAIMSKLSVCSVTQNHLKDVQNLVENISTVESLLVDLQLAINNKDDLCAFALLSEEQIVGVVVLKQEDNMDYFRSHYDLSKMYIKKYHDSDAYGTIKHFVVSPIFLRHLRFFCGEILRLSDYSVLYYHLYPYQRDKTFCCCIGSMYPVKPRRRPEFTMTNLEDCEPADAVCRDENPFALFVLTPRLCGLPRYEINTKIVIVGSSDTALSFLEALIRNNSRQHLCYFTNMNLVSPHGLNNSISHDPVRNMMFVTRSNYNYRHMCLTSLGTYTNLIYGVMTGIDRKNKILLINENKFVAYDLLFIMCGKQFQKPSMKHHEHFQQSEKRISQFPDNVFVINTEKDAYYSLVQTKCLIREDNTAKYTIIVYGRVLETYCCIAALLSFNVPGKNIVFVEPFPSLLEGEEINHEPQFADQDIDSAVIAALNVEEVTRYSSYHFIDWVLDKEKNSVTSVKFQSKTRYIEIDCLAMFMYNNKSVSAKTFLAINQAGLVFDGGLVIGADCRTNDPYIYAAGTITKYSRRYYADHLKHKYFNKEEIGRKLGLTIKKRLFPLSEDIIDEEPLKCQARDMLIPVYKQPLITFCHLPGKLQYFNVTAPGKPVPVEAAMNSPDYGQVLITGDCKNLSKQGYFRLHLNPQGVVDSITCLAKFDIDQKNLTSVWGKHEKLLNNLYTRFSMILITDLFEYFREPWACAIYHDRFNILETEIEKIMMSFTCDPGNSPIEDAVNMYEDSKWKQLSLEQFEQIKEKLTNSAYQKIIEQKVLDFLDDNNSYLPMYAHPNVVRLLIRGIENSPLFDIQ